MLIGILVVHVSSDAAVRPRQLLSLIGAKSFDEFPIRSRNGLTDCVAEGLPHKRGALGIDGVTRALMGGLMQQSEANLVT